MRKKWLLLLPVFACTYSCTQAQAGRDSLALFRDFITVSNAYKQPPFYLSMEVRNTAGLITEANDTIGIKAEFYVKQEAAYVRFDEFEQIVGDSMALLVSDKLKQMILYRDAAPVIRNMKNIMGIRTEDSSLARWAQKYTASVSHPSMDTVVIVLQSRARVYGSSLAKEAVEMRYNPSTKFPQQVLTTTRELFPLDSLQYTALTGRPELSGKLLAPGEGRYFVIKEKQQVFIYTTIEQNTERKIPVLIADRIIRTAEGEYKPVKQYETYRLQLN